MKFEIACFRASLIFLMLMTSIFSNSSLFAVVSLPFGDGSGQVGFSNQNNHPEAEGGIPLGPLSFRINGDETWVLDSVGGRVFQISAEGKITNSIQVADPKAAMLEDFALIRDTAGKVTSIWVLNAFTQEAVHLAVDGKQLGKVGGHGEDPGNFSQFQRIEIDSSGRLFIGDLGRRVISIFDSAGQILREVEWEWSGFCLDGQGNLCRLQWDETAHCSHLLIETFDGQSVKNIPLPIGEHVNPVLWFISDKSEAIISYNPPGNLTSFALARCNLDGKGISTTELKPPVGMNRFLEPGSALQFWLAEASFVDAPKGNFTVNSFSMK
ncbi:hypothetical protein HYY75_03005 [bacterium]|nr:hypothetical protein [bacterium]